MSFRKATPVVTWRPPSDLKTPTGTQCSDSGKIPVALQQAQRGQERPGPLAAVSAAWGDLPSLCPSGVPLGETEFSGQLSAHSSLPVPQAGLRSSLRMPCAGDPLLVHWEQGCSEGALRTSCLRCPVRRRQHSTPVPRVWPDSEPQQCLTHRLCSPWALIPVLMLLSLQKDKSM